MSLVAWAPKNSIALYSTVCDTTFSGNLCQINGTRIKALIC
jgi:hypothetical protein